MSLSPPVPRERLHTRNVQCDGYRREDGLWEVEATIQDVKSYPFRNRWRGLVDVGDPIHEMTLRLTLDDRLNIKRAEAFTKKSPYEVCPPAAGRFKALEGLRIKSGWMRQVKERYGGAIGCTHILELLYPAATTAFQTVFAYREKKLMDEGMTEGEANRRKGPPVNSCYAFSEESPVMKRMRAEMAAANAKEPAE